MFEAYPIETQNIIIKFGSWELKNSDYFTKCRQVLYFTCYKLFFKYVVGSAAAIFAFTWLLHRRRAWALTNSGLMRSFWFKYFPISIVLGRYKLQNSKKMAVDKVDEDFG